MRGLVALVVGLWLGAWSVASWANDYPAVKQWVAGTYGEVCAPNLSVGVVSGCLVNRFIGAMSSGWEVCSASPMYDPDPATVSRGWYVTVKFTRRIGSNPCEEPSVGSVYWRWSCPLGGELQNDSAAIAGVGAGMAWCQGGEEEPECPEGSAYSIMHSACICHESGFPPVNGSCSCPAGQVRNPYRQNVCTEPCTDHNGQGWGATFAQAGGVAGKSLCEWVTQSDYCVARVGDVGFAVSSGWRYPLTFTGSFCDPTQHPPLSQDPLGDDEPGPDDDDEVDTEADKCQRQGKTYGTFNGVGMCLERGSPDGQETTSEGERSETKTENGQTTQTTTKTEVTTSTDGTVTVTTTTTKVTDPGGENESTDITVDQLTGSRGEVCAAKPSLAMCRGDGKGDGGGTGEIDAGDGDGDGDGGDGFSGNCEAGFQCEGDPITCAIAREQHIRNCQLWKETDQSNLFDAALRGEDPGDAALKKENWEQVELGSGVIDTSRWLGGGCVEDFTTSIMGVSIEIPFSRLCPYLDFMGAIVVAFAMLAAMRIIFV